MRLYKKEMQQTTIQEGCWLKKDRKQNTQRWLQVNKYNILLENGYLKYKTISQKRDFYLWFDEERKKKGDEIKWAGIASIAANQLAKVEVGFLRVFIVRNKEIVAFSQIGSEKVFAFAFPKLREIYFSKEPLKGEKAQRWDQEYGLQEQCEVLEPIYTGLSQKALNKLEKMAKGKGIFSLGIPKKLRYEGEIGDCEQRYAHGMNKLLPYYLEK